MEQACTSNCSRVSKGGAQVEISQSFPLTEIDVDVIYIDVTYILLN